MKKFKVILKWLILCLLTGVFAGGLGAVFAHILTLVTNLRLTNGWLLLLLPLGGVATVKIYKLCRTTGLSTNTVLGFLDGKKQISPMLVPAVFSGTVLTHLFGGSAGREGAALQLGGGMATLFSKWFGLKDNEAKIATICGMSAFFSALFGTPLSAAVFAVEVMSQKKQSIKALLPSLFSGFTAFLIAQGLLVRAERFPLKLPEFSLTLLWQGSILVILASAVCMLFVFSLHKAEKLFQKWFKNLYIRILFGSGILILLTVIIGNQDYNGGGINIIEQVFTHNKVNYEAFLLKILFTAVTIAGGFKGGEIVPTLFIGATFGGAAASLLGISAPFGAALGMAALFSGATNCMAASILLCCEMFGFKGILYYAFASIISFLITGENRLYNT